MNADGFFRDLSAAFGNSAEFESQLQHLLAG